MRKWIPAVIILATLVFTAAAYSGLPERMPIHWNARGEPDGFGSRFWGAFGLPIFLVVIWGILRAIPYLDPRRANIEAFRDTFDELIIATVGVTALIHVAALGAALGWPVGVGRVVPAAVGLLFVYLGRLFPRFKSNWFIGIRTPWTLSSDTVWQKTHRLGGRAMMAVGVLLIAAAFAGTEKWYIIAVAGSAAMVAGVLVYSYVAWRSEQPKG